MAWALVPWCISRDNHWDQVWCLDRSRFQELVVWSEGTRESFALLCLCLWLWTIDRPDRHVSRVYPWCRAARVCSGGVWHVFITCTVFSFWYYLFESYSSFCSFYAFLRRQSNPIPAETLQSRAIALTPHVQYYKQTFWCIIKRRSIACLPTGHLYLLSSTKYLNM